MEQFGSQDWRAGRIREWLLLLLRFAILNGYDAITRPCRDHRKAMGPRRTPAASSANKADHPAGCLGPPAASSATPAPQPPSAERPNPTVECSARVAPR